MLGISGGCGGGGGGDDPSGDGITPMLMMLSQPTWAACIAMQEVLEELQDKYDVEAEEIFTKDRPDLAEKYDVKYTPTLVLFDANGKQIAKHVGMLSVEGIADLFASNDITLELK